MKANTSHRSSLSRGNFKEASPKAKEAPETRRKPLRHVPSSYFQPKTPRFSVGFSTGWDPVYALFCPYFVLNRVGIVLDCFVLSWIYGNKSYSQHLEYL
jgi:hypothetical protein